MFSTSFSRRSIIGKTVFAILIIFAMFNLINSFYLQKNIKSQTTQVVNNTNSAVDLSFRPWRNDPECSSFVVQFIRNGSQSPMALATFPGSGNTWIRGLIERLTGYFTGSVYGDQQLFKQGTIINQ